jgi:hypothetical protein
MYSTGPCARLRPEHASDVWADDLIEDSTPDGRKFRMLCVVDEFTREALAIRVARRLSSSDVIDTLADLFIACGAPAHIRSDQGPEFVAEGDCREFRVWSVMMGKKDVPHGQAKRTPDP